MRGSGLLAVAGLGAALACTRVVPSGEVAVIFRLGAVHRQRPPGLTFALPWPLERVERVNIGEVRRLSPGPVRLLTGDTNLVDLDLIVQVTVRDPAAWLTAAGDPDALARAATLSAAAEVVRAMGVDALLTTGRAELQQLARASAQAELDRAGVGLHIDAVEVRELSPPPAVVDAFNDVSSARGDRETLALGAEAAASERLPQARGEADARVQAARAAAAVRAARARAHLQRVDALLPAWQASPAAVEARLRSESLGRIGAAVQLRAAPAGAALAAPDLLSPAPP